MIKVGIVGADSSDAGELLRILVNHPEVEVTTLYSQSLSGRKVADRHHGFIGEEAFQFTDKIDPTKLDAVFVADCSVAGDAIIERSEEWPELRIINLAPGRFEKQNAFDMEYGLSEINRKALVRGARRAIVPTPAASVALTALYPLASHLLLASDITIEVEAPEGLVADLDAAKIAAEISRQLRKAQNSFAGNVDVRIKKNGFHRAMRVKTELKCPLAAEEIGKVYESVYDDHNFTFVTRGRVAETEVEGTQKCVVSFCKPGAGLLEIEAVADARMRGGAGDAVHILNLLFALHEKVGLSLKPSGYGVDSGGRKTDGVEWFA